MSLYTDLIEKKEKLSLVGLGYVGMPIAVAFAKKIKVVRRHLLCPDFATRFVSAFFFRT